ncbi:MAG: tRNA-guanine transglycosylase, partial [Kiloniellales bacterium]
RTGQAFTRRGTVNLRNARHLDDPRPLDPDCPCPTCGGYSRAYLHHLFRAGEMLGPILLTRHNLHYYQQLMAGLRGAIEAGTTADFAAGFAALQAQGDLPAR